MEKVQVELSRKGRKFRFELRGCGAGISHTAE